MTVGKPKGLRTRMLWTDPFSTIGAQRFMGYPPGKTSHYILFLFTAAGAKASVGTRYDSFILKTELEDIVNHMHSTPGLCSDILFISLLFLGLKFQLDCIRWSLNPQASSSSSMTAPTCATEILTCGACKRSLWHRLRPFVWFFFSSRRV